MFEVEPRFEMLERQLKEAPMTYIPALLAIIIARCKREPIFKGWMGMHSFIQKVYKDPVNWKLGPMAQPYAQDAHEGEFHD